MLKFQYFTEFGIENWKNLLNRCTNLNISQNPASDIEEIIYIDATISIFRRIQHRILKKSSISMHQSQYFAESGIGYWKNLLNRCTNLNISQNPASDIEEIIYIDATISIFHGIRHRILKKYLYRCWRSYKQNPAANYHNRIEQSRQVRFKLPESLRLWRTCCALCARCCLL